jgi:hypothetical protein
MKIESKFGLNQKVWYIHYQMKQVFHECKFCGGVGEITVNDITRSCPECYGRKGHTKNVAMQYEVIGMRTIGLVRCEVRSIGNNEEFVNIGEYEPESIEVENQYMAYETGIGSGTLYPEEKLFASRELAQERCDELNC